MTKFLSIGVAYDTKDGFHLIENSTLEMFQSTIGSLLWLARCTRPDIGYAMHRAIRGGHSSRECDWRWTKRIVCYMKGTIEPKLQLKEMATEDEPPKIILESYSDEDYSANRTDRKSVSGGVSFLKK